MENTGGWVKLWRKMLDDPLMRRPAYRAVWVEILLRASHDGKTRVLFDGKKRILSPGEFTTGAYQLAQGTGVPRGTVENIIRTFKNEELIEVQTDRQCSLITVKKWKQYQKIEERVEERLRNDQGTTEERLRTKQEGEEGKKEKNTGAEPEAPQVDDGSKEVMAAFYDYGINRQLNFGNKTDRAAAAFLVKQVGLEKLLKVIESLAHSNGQPYAPVITTPHQLRTGWAKLDAFWKRKKIEPKKGLHSL